MSSKVKTIPLYVGLFLISAAVLHLEILQTRIFSFMLWHHVTYLVVTFTLLGFAAAGAFVAVRPSLLQGNLPLKLTVFTAVFGITTVAAFALLTLIRLDTVDLLENKVQYFLLFVYYIYLIVPYFFGGLVIVMILSSQAKDVNRLYFVNLVGSGLGCLFFLPVLGWTGGAGSIFVVVGIIFLSGIFLALSGERKAVPGLVSTGLVIAAAIGFFSAEKIIDIKPAPSKVMSVNIEQYGGELENTYWDPMCRIDVVKNPRTQGRHIYQDGDAPTIMQHYRPGIKGRIDHYSLSYLIQDKPDVLVIGVGGGQDIVQALTFDASSITGAEINASIHHMMKTEYAPFSGSLYNGVGGDIVVAEGRSFLKRSEKNYDVIQMTGTDTYSALSSGSFVLSESYLYTLDAFHDYFDHLTENGVVGILRFRFYPPRECMRLMSIGATMMKERGIERPSQHILVVSYQRPPVEIEALSGVNIAYAVMLFKKTPFTEDQVDKYRRLCEHLSAAETGYTLSYAPGVEEGEKEIQDLLAAMDRGEEEAFYTNYHYDITPVSDDKPFFFGYHKWKTMFDKVTSPNYQGVIGEDPVGLYILLSVLIEATVLVALLVIVPLLVFRRRGLKVASSGRIMFYFFVLGISYMFIEIASMQKFVLFLGHPTYSLSIVLFTFLLFSGLGSFFGQRFQHAPMKGITIAIFSIVVLLVALQFLLPVVFEHALSLQTAARMAVAVALLAPLAFFMGMPFPLGIRLVDARAPEAIPWAFGINGGASVLSSVASVVLAMATGFTTVFLFAGVLYLMGWFFYKNLSPSTK